MGKHPSEHHIFDQQSADMANYGYGGGYQTTSYGAQGGADGGGFMGGSQQGSQDSPGGNKQYGKDSLRPVTIKQIIDAQQPHPDAEFSIDGSPVTQLTFIGQINQVSSQEGEYLRVWGRLK